jgi:hypothetical protein
LLLLLLLLPTCCPCFCRRRSSPLALFLEVAFHNLLCQLRELILQRRIQRLWARRLQAALCCHRCLIRLFKCP